MKKERCLQSNSKEDLCAQRTHVILEKQQLEEQVRDLSEKAHKLDNCGKSKS